MRDLSMLIKPASSDCNLNCRYCFYRKISQSRSVYSHGIMSRETIERIVNNAFLSAERSVSIIFQGGEPLLCGVSYYRDFAELIKRHNTRGIRVNLSLQTNGTLIDGEFARLFAEQGYLIGLSLDGYADLHNYWRSGSYSAVMRAAGELSRNGVQFNILCTSTDMTAKHIEKVYNFYKKNKFCHGQFTNCISYDDDAFLTPQGWLNMQKRLFDLWYDDLMRGEYVSIRHIDNYVMAYMGRQPTLCSVCGECTCQFAFESDGCCFPCDFYMSDEWLMGNINDMTFDELYNSHANRQFAERSRQLKHQCRKCGYFAICGGGCIAERGQDGYVYCAQTMQLMQYILPRMPGIARMVSQQLLPTALEH